MVGLALLGAGRIAAVHARSMQETGARLVSVFDPVTAVAEDLAKRYGAEVADTAEAAIGHREVQGVVVASSTDTHVDLILAGVRAGRAVLCEKPIDLDIARARQCQAALAGLDVPVQIGFNRRFDPTHAALAAALRQDEIGRLENLLIVSRDPAPPPKDYMLRSGGLFRDMTIHDFDMARFLLGEEPVEVSAAASALFDETAAELGDIDSASVQLKTASGVLCQIVNSRRAVYGYDQRIEAFGAKGVLQSENLRPTALRRSGAESTDAKAPLLHFFLERYAESYRHEMTAFLACITNNAPPPVTVDDGVRALALAEAAAEAVREKTVVTLEP
ncbi:MAG: inositol 2-dehydrogenase [Kiloniellales bacterium]|nr:inositol 2-dehydrogenase [Kiloniellales bacterium]